jgi:hypothetical protein
MKLTPMQRPVPAWVVRAGSPTVAKPEVRTELGSLSQIVSGIRFVTVEVLLFHLLLCPLRLANSRSSTDTRTSQDVPVSQKLYSLH